MHHPVCSTHRPATRSVVRFRVAAVAIAITMATAVFGETGTMGGTLGDFSLLDTNGRRHRLSDYKEKKLVVLAFLGTECPLAKLYAGRLQSIANAYEGRSVVVLGLDPNVQDSMEEIAAFSRKHDLRYVLLKDSDNRIANQAKITRTPEVVLLDEQRSIRYRGRIDDQYVIGVARDAPTRNDLREAIDDLLQGKPVSVPTTEAIGCLIGRVRTADTQSDITYCNQIVRILHRRCTNCHREGQIGPFSLTNFDDASGWGAMVDEVVQQERMPPWHANPQFGKFANDARMTQEEKDLLHQWVADGCPEGDPQQLPSPPTYTVGWQLPHAPDLVIRMSIKPFVVPSSAGPSGLPYQYRTVPSNFESDRWVSHAEVQPGNRAVVHHIIVYVVPPGKQRRRDWIFFSAYVPGLRHDALPTGAAQRIPAGSTFVFEQHYTPVGSEQQDISRIGLIFADGPAGDGRPAGDGPAGDAANGQTTSSSSSNRQYASAAETPITHEAITVEVGNSRFRIPPGSPEHVVTCTSRPMERDDLQLISLSPHMHLRGKSFRYEILQENGDREVLLDVPAYDFNWQTQYVLEQPKKLPRNAVIFCRAVFDNSKENLSNPDPTKAITYGEQSWDEMMIGFFQILVPLDPMRKNEHLPQSGYDTVGEFERTDSDSNGHLTHKEAQTHTLIGKHFSEIDADGNKRITLPEALQAARAAKL